VVYLIFTDEVAAVFSRRKKLRTTVILQADRVVDTIEILQKRIGERFPQGTGLFTVCGQILEIARRDSDLATRLARPYVLLRMIVGLAMLAAFVLVAVVMVLVLFVPLVFTQSGPGAPFLAEHPLVQFLLGVEAALQLAIFIFAGIRLLPGSEAYVKRRRALPALRALRSIVHVIDMHQLTKDPSKFIVGTGGEGRTGSSPAFELSEFQMTRYLDYCSEMLSLTSKVAALFGQAINDEVVAEVVSEIERLSGGLSQKIWQKIMILQRLREQELALTVQPHPAA